MPAKNHRGFEISLEAEVIQNSGSAKRKCRADCPAQVF
jgi:hypothetical protein